MCGIVGYFGGAGNNLTRVLTAMSALIYRAPDSTGVGIFGDQEEPARTRKSIGAVDRLLAELIRDPIYSNRDEALMTFWTGADDGDARRGQRRILELEQLPLERYDALTRGDEPYPRFDQLVDLGSASPVTLSAGVPGRPGPLPEFTVRSKSDLKILVDRLLADYDLSFVAIQTLLHQTLEARLADRRPGRKGAADPAELKALIDRLLEEVFFEERAPRSSRLDYGWPQVGPQARRRLWRILAGASIRVPADYDRDGVRCTFRLLDAALLTRFSLNPRIKEQLDERLRAHWPEGSTRFHLDWISFYRAEKGMNVFGRAAGAGLAWLQEQLLPPTAARGVSGETDPLSLRYFAPPIISQGRWALQSPVTVKNGHPFFDHQKHRMVVLNGQFNGEVESELHAFLKKVGGFSFRSENSSEYLALLWGYFYDWLSGEKHRYESIRTQIERGLEPYSIGSQSIDYQVYRRVAEKSDADLDQAAFLEAVRRMVRRGGQLAVAAMSLHSPGRLYVAAHNRPVFVVRRLDNDDFMVVSDINAAMGLFPQEMIHETTLKLKNAQRRLEKALEKLRSPNSAGERAGALKTKYRLEETRLLDRFKVSVLALEGEEISARISVAAEKERVGRKVEITDFIGSPIPDLKPFHTTLNPLQTRKDLSGSFFTTHLREIPGRLEEILHFYAGEGADPPRFDLRESLFRRRFGRELKGIRRILLAGTGSARNMGAVARPLLQELLPEVDTLLLSPTEMPDMAASLVPERDLVILLSWSGSTAEMVQLAKRLEARSLVMTAVTEKRFSDLGLLAQKSGGVIPVLSGEEVTVPGIKSTLCTLFCLYLFGAWLTDRMGYREQAQAVMAKLGRVSAAVSEVLEDRGINAFSIALANQSAKSHCAVIVDALHSAGTGREVAWKLEETSWTAIGKAVDYRDLPLNSLGKAMDETLILVNATCEKRMAEAIEAMKQLYLKGIPFAAVSYENGLHTEIEDYSQGQCVLLPRLDDNLQVLVDLVFYYQLAFHFGLAHGRSPEDFPRNRAKSVTSGRTGSVVRLTPAAEIFQLEQRAGTEAVFHHAEQTGPESQWASSSQDPERAYYRSMGNLALALRAEDPVQKLLQLTPQDLTELTALLFGKFSEEVELILVPFDREAEAAAKSFSALWSRYLGRMVRVAMPEQASAHGWDEHLCVLMGAREPSEARLREFWNRVPGKNLWCGVPLSQELTTLFDRSSGSCFLSESFQQAEGEALYTALGFLLLRMWHSHEPEKASPLEKHFRNGAWVIQSTLNDPSLKKNIRRAMAANATYRTAYVIGPPGGAGAAWVNRFDRLGGLIAERHGFGQSAHGPLVTVDPRADKKYIPLEPRSQMVVMYGEQKVSAWEQEYLEGQNIDQFLLQPLLGIATGGVRPFFAEGRWYLPELRRDYDGVLDNLIILDATSDRFFDAALDELAGYGCRFARMIVVTQEAFLTVPERRALYQHPISHLLLLPGMGGQAGQPISSILLPFALNPLGMALASAALENRG